MWKTVKLGEVCEFENGDRGKNYPSKKHQVEKGIPFINAGDLSADGKITSDGMAYITNERFERLGAGKIEIDDILFCLRGSLGKCAINKSFDKGAIASSLVIMRANKSELIPEFLLYFLKSHLTAKLIQETAGGAAQPNLSAKVVSNYQLFIPPLAEQKRIVAKLDAAFAEIDVAIDATKEKDLGALHFAFLKKSFSDYSSETTKKCLAECVETFHQGLNTAGEKVKFSDIGYPVLQTRNIIDGEIDFQEKIKFVDEDVWQKYRQKYKPALGDVFFTNIGTIGKTAIVSDDADFLIHWNIFKIKVNPALLLPEFLKLNLDFLTGTGYFDALQKGGTVNFVTKKMIGEAPIFMMSLNAQRKTIANYNKFLAKLAVSQSLRKQSLKNFDSLKSAILAQELQSEAA